MAPLPQNNTARVFVDYTSLSVQHTLMVRPLPGATVPDMAALATNVANVLRARMATTDSFFAARYSLALSDFSLPLTFEAVPGVVSAFANIWTEDPESAFISLCGRSTTSGRRVRWDLYTPIRAADWPADNRFNPGENGPVDTLRLNWTAVVAGEAGPAPSVVAIDGSPVIVYEYVNIAKNAYWQRKQRIS